MELFHAAILRALPFVPKPVIRRIAGRYIAGETLEDLLRVAASLHERGFLSTVDVLGENVQSKEEAQRAAEEYSRVVEKLAGHGPSPQISVKLTLLGLKVAEDLALGLLEDVTCVAEKRKVSVFLDMEDSSTTDATLRIYRRARERHSGVGVAIQACLHRSIDDLLDLLPLRPVVRVCKGIYNEPPQLALKDRRAIQESYMKLVTLLADGHGYPAIATHDPWLVDASLELLAKRGMGPETHEFQMLLGVGESLQPRIRAAGSRIRLYCPYGPDWYAYSLRRLRENPKMAGYVLKSLFSLKLLDRGHLNRGA